MFGTCCLLKAEVHKFNPHESHHVHHQEENNHDEEGEYQEEDHEMIEEMPVSNLAAVSSYEKYGSASESYFDKKKHEQDAIDKFMNDADMIDKYHLLNEATSYSYSTVPPEDHKTTLMDEEHETPTTNLYLPNIYNQAYSDELPVANRFEDTTSEDFDFYTAKDEDSTTMRDTTDVTEYPTTPYYNRRTTTYRPTRVTYAKPQFKPRPTKISSNNNYVLVETISNERINETKHDVSENNMESIESIILMLNDTNPGPSYDSGASTERYGSESIEQTYQTSIYRPVTRQPPRPNFITSSTSSTTAPSNPYESKRPNLEAIYSQSSTYGYNDFASSPIYHPSTNYISVSQSTSTRPIVSQTPQVEIIKTTVGASKRPVVTSLKTTTLRTTSKTTSKRTTTKRRTRPPPPSTTTTTKKTTTPSTTRPFSVKVTTPAPTRKPPSTSYVYSPTPTRRPITRKPTPTKPSTIITAADFTTTNRLPADYVVQSKPVNEDRPYIQIHIPTSERPSPTVHITPKPAQPSTKKTPSSQTPSSSPSTSARPTIPSLPQGISVIYNQSPAILIPAPADFENEGYFGISTTIRPTLEHSVTQTSIYTIVPGNKRPPTIEAYTPSPPPSPQLHSSIQPTYDYNNAETIATSNNDFVNFPPVRNPNLNATGYIAVGSDEQEDIDESYDEANKMPTFIHDEVVVNKLDLLVSKIVASLQPNFNGLADAVYERRNVTIIKDSPQPPQPTTTTRKPVTKKTTTANSNKKATTKPSNKPLADSQITTKRPQKATTKKPVATTKKPATTKRPITKVKKI